MTDPRQLDELTQFLRDNRGSEAHFQQIEQRLHHTLSEAQENGASGNFTNALQEAVTHAEEYKTQKEKGVASWPLFEKVVTAFEKAVVDARHQA